MTGGRTSSRRETTPKELVVTQPATGVRKTPQHFGPIGARPAAFDAAFGAFVVEGDQKSTPQIVSIVACFHQLRFALSAALVAWICSRMRRQSSSLYANMLEKVPLPMMPMPPSIAMISPLMYSTSSLSRKAAMLASSDGLPTRPIGLRET